MMAEHATNSDDGLWQVRQSAVSAEAMAGSWPSPNAASDKYSRGVVGVDTGSSRYPGAAVLSTLGALRSGAGFVRYCGTDAAKAAILARCPSVTFGVGRVNAWVVGSGWDDDEANAARLAARLADGVPVVIDAGALWVIDDALEALGWKSLPANCLLTPHAGELARLLGVTRADVTANPLMRTAKASERYGASVLLKGAEQYCVGPTGEMAGSAAVVDVFKALPGPAWTAQAGSGDVLAGVAGALLAAGLGAPLAGALAASLRALTAERHPGPWAPDQLADHFPETIAAFA